MHAALGVPRDADASDDYLMDEGLFVLSYNPRREVPNWVSWNLNRSYLGHVRRQNEFRPNPALPAEFYRVTSADYARSGYDRGHLCPSADRERTPEDNAVTFLMTNMQPQLHELNAGPWEKLEEYERELAQAPDAELYIVAGGLFAEPAPTIGHGVAVPSASYKIIVVLREGQRAVDVSDDSEVIAVIMPNEAGVGDHVWTDFVTSVDEIETRTGYDFLSDVPDAVEQRLETRVTRPFVALPSRRR